MTGGNVYGKTDGVDELYGWSAAMSDRLSIISRAAHPMDTLMQDAYAGPLKPEAPAHAADHVRIRNLAERLEEYEAKELEWEKEEKRLVAENRSLRAKLSIAKGTAPGMRLSGSLRWTRIVRSIRRPTTTNPSVVPGCSRSMVGLCRNGVVREVLPLRSASVATVADVRQVRGATGRHRQAPSGA
jgi:hypothetical protein